MYLAEYTPGKVPIAVAIKQMRLKSTAAEKEEFLAEAELILLLDHPSIVKACGVDIVMSCN